MRFKVGDRVEWTSQAAGVSKTKVGEVEMLIPAGKRPEMKDVGNIRDHLSYVVRANGRAYWPRVSALRFATEAT